MDAARDRDEFIEIAFHKDAISAIELMVYPNPATGSAVAEIRTQEDLNGAEIHHRCVRAAHASW
ncbi:MAG: hypothetical protein IPH53_04390 [Flavobacteriales bacterium]|nr:hypothetical protein [Flavobacteriales bacterium]